ncbi:MAG TPA: hypothetical protein VH083_23280 [Myxococcales bacterium]|nr:hypothetical protein [Myxococcales bacterium]
MPARSHAKETDDPAAPRRIAPTILAAAAEASPAAPALHASPAIRVSSPAAQPATAPAAEEPEIHVHIGRIEVRASSPAPAPAPRRPPLALSLEQYLERGKRRGP